MRLWGNKDMEDTGSAISHGEETQTAVEIVGAVGSVLGWRVHGHAPFCPVQAQVQGFLPLIGGTFFLDSMVLQEPVFLEAQ